MSPTAVPTIPLVRFVVLGDTGTGHLGQKAVAAVVAEKCGAANCDFVVLLGDNFYPSGVASAGDPQWESKFEAPYAAIPVPFYALLGNHDYGNDGDGDLFALGAHQVAYGAVNAKWRMPAEWYAFDAGPASLLALGSNLLVFDHEPEQQRDFFTAALAGSTRPWKIAMMHHPYLSNGHHGNAGSYDGHTHPVKSGAHYKAFVDDVLCGEVDLFFSGHDHNLQVLPGTAACPGIFVVSGAGAFSSPLSGANPSLWQANTTGFAYVVVTEASATVEMVDAGTGTTAFTITILRE